MVNLLKSFKKHSTSFSDLHVFFFNFLKSTILFLGFFEPGLGGGGLGGEQGGLGGGGGGGQGPFEVGLGGGGQF